MLLVFQSNLSFLSLIFISTFFMSSCGKKEKCNDGEVCIENTSSTHTKEFIWKRTGEVVVLEPRQIQCFGVGPMNVYGALRGGTEENVYATYICGDVGLTETRHLMESCNDEIPCECSGTNRTALCNNGVFDPEDGEADVDCGGYCNPCTSLEKSGCNLNQNSIELSSNMGGSSTFDWFKGKTVPRPTGKGITMEFKFDKQENLSSNELSSTYLRARIEIGEMPKHTRVFYVGNKKHQISLEYDMNVSLVADTDWHADTGQKVVMLKGENGIWTLEMCDIRFTNENEFITGSGFISSKLSFNANNIEE